MPPLPDPKHGPALREALEHLFASTHFNRWERDNPAEARALYAYFDHPVDPPPPMHTSFGSFVVLAVHALALQPDGAP